MPGSPNEVQDWVRATQVMLQVSAKFVDQQAPLEQLPLEVVIQHSLLKALVLSQLALTQAVVELTNRLAPTPDPTPT